MKRALARGRPPPMGISYSNLRALALEGNPAAYPIGNRARRSVSTTNAQMYPEFGELGSQRLAIARNKKHLQCARDSASLAEARLDIAVLSCVPPWREPGESRQSVTKKPDSSGNNDCTHSAGYTDPIVSKREIRLLPERSQRVPPGTPGDRATGSGVRRPSHPRPTLVRQLPSMSILLRRASASSARPLV